MYSFLGIEGQTVPQLREPPCVCRNLLGILLCECNPSLTNGEFSQNSDDEGIFDGRAVLAPSVIATQVLGGLHRQQGKAHRSVVFATQCQQAAQKRCAVGLRVAEHDVVNPLFLCEFLSDCGV
jgi:hypothetical protein